MPGDVLKPLPNAGAQRSRRSPRAADEPLSPAVDEYVAAGTPAILESPYVSQGPGRLATAPVPSIFSDDRGEIHRLRVGSRRLNILFSKKSVMRSGYLHPHEMQDFVVRGKVEVWALTETGTVKTIYGENEYFVNKPYTPHILHFLEDTVILEWWGTEPFECWYYHPFRRIIDVQNTLVSKSTGKLQHLVPRDLGGEGQESMGASGKYWWFTAGIVLGAAIGTVLAAGTRRRK